MVTTNYDVATGNDDYAWRSDTGYTYNGTTIACLYDNILGIWGWCKSKIDTSSIPAGAVITAATVYWYIHSAAGGKGVNYQYDVAISTDDSSWTTFFQYNNAAPHGTGWKSHALTAGELSNINTSGYTYLWFTCNDPGAGKARSTTFRAYEYVTQDTYDAYIAVTYTVPAGQVIMFMHSD